MVVDPTAVGPLGILVELEDPFPFGRIDGRTGLLDRVDVASLLCDRSQFVTGFSNGLPKTFFVEGI